MSEEKNAVTERKNTPSETKNGTTERENTLPEEKNAAPERKNVLSEEKNATSERKNTPSEEKNKLSGQKKRSVRGKKKPSTFSFYVSRRITRQGLPTANESSGISCVTTLPAPITQRSPIVTPGQITVLPPIQQSAPTVTG